MEWAEQALVPVLVLVVVPVPGLVQERERLAPRWAQSPVLEPELAQQTAVMVGRWQRTAVVAAASGEEVRRQQRVESNQQVVAVGGVGPVQE